jgi:hypothetical protein
MCEMPRYRAVLSDIRLLTRRDRTRWLGRQDLNPRIRNRARLGPTAIVRRKEWQQIVRRLAASSEASGNTNS